MAALEPFSALQAGDHVGFLSAGEVEQQVMLHAFITQGLKRNARVSLCLHVESVTRIMDDLWRRAFRVEDWLQTGQLNIISMTDSELSMHLFNPDLSLQSLQQEMETAHLQGFSGLWYAREMTWAAAAIDAARRITQFEKRAAGFLQAHPLVLLCQYDRAVFDDQTLLQALAYHSHVGVGDQVCARPEGFPWRGLPDGVVGGSLLERWIGYFQTNGGNSAPDSAA